ncbi:hypothetical protein [Sphingomonas sp. PR090111-T3T-6A]|uniref:hypothetical protein n=1 Tax=Sphingomonas sp. PR090111-T3T-6A TaxID=685778 RepID=UPI0012FC47CE|nr:hypothetical protein [Sphingomonas sp. PR090111-T3T-6A]
MEAVAAADMEQDEPFHLPLISPPISFPSAVLRAVGAALRKMNRAKERRRQPQPGGASIISFIKPVWTIFLSLAEGQFKYFVFLYDGSHVMTLGKRRKGYRKIGGAA